MSDTPRSDVVVFIGVIGAGKDFAANELRDNAGYRQINFKDALLALVSDIVGYDVAADYDWFKSNIVGVKRPDNKFLETYIFTDTRDLLVKHPELMTGRRLLTRLGTEGMRKRDTDYWVKEYIREAESELWGGGKVVTADCRFMNEVRAIRVMSKGEAEFVFCNYKSQRYNPTLDHASERLAQSLLALGLQHNQPITEEHFKAIESSPKFAEIA